MTNIYRLLLVSFTGNFLKKNFSFFQKSDFSKKKKKKKFHAITFICRRRYFLRPSNALMPRPLLLRSTCNSPALLLPTK